MSKRDHSSPVIQRKEASNRLGHGSGTIPKKVLKYSECSADSTSCKCRKISLIRADPSNLPKSSNIPERNTERAHSDSAYGDRTRFEHFASLRDFDTTPRNAAS